jgi:PAS domain S-box-containing protein
MKDGLVDDHKRGDAPAGEPETPGLAALELLYQFAAAVELTPNVAVHSTDRHGIVRYWNNTCAALIGVAAHEAVGRPLASLVSHPGRDVEFAHLLASVWDSARAAPAGDWQIRRRDGRELWVHASHFPVKRAGATQHILCTQIDITARKADEDRLMRAGANFRLLFERSSDAIVLLDGGAMVDANPAAVRLFHCAGKQQLTGRSLLGSG